jgi:hypothetical protein
VAITVYRKIGTPRVEGSSGRRKSPKRGPRHRKQAA